MPWSGQVGADSRKRGFDMEFGLLGQSPLRRPLQQFGPVLCSMVGDKFQAEIKRESAQAEHFTDPGHVRIQRVSPSHPKQDAGQDNDAEPESLDAEAGLLNPVVSLAEDAIHPMIDSIRRSLLPLFPAFGRCLW